MPLKFMYTTVSKCKTFNYHTHGPKITGLIEDGRNARLLIAQIYTKSTA